MQKKNETENTHICFVSISLRLSLVQHMPLAVIISVFLEEVEIMVISLGNEFSEEEDEKPYQVRTEMLIFLMLWLSLACCEVWKIISEKVARWGSLAFLLCPSTP